MRKKNVREGHICYIYNNEVTDQKGLTPRLKRKEEARLGH